MSAPGVTLRAAASSPPSARHGHGESNPPDEEPHVPDEDVPAQRVSVDLRPGGDHSAQNQRPDQDVRPAHTQRIALAAPLARSTNRRLRPPAGRCTRASARIPAATLSSTVAMPSATDPSERSRARSSMAPPTVSSSQGPPAVQYKLTAAEANARPAASQAVHRARRRASMPANVRRSRAAYRRATHRHTARSRLPASTGERPRSEPGYTGACVVDASRLGLFALGHLLARGGDVELVERGAPEGARRDLADRQFEHLVDRPVRAVAADRGSAPEGDPDSALAVDGAT